MNYREIKLEIENKNLKPIYFLMGEENYYIDLLANHFSNDILNEQEKEFNQITLYGNDINTEQIISECKQYPIGTNKRLVIIKEAQNLKKIEILDSYIDNPQKSTVLVICYKKKSIDKRKKFGKNLTKKCVIFESKKLYDNEVHEWIIKYVKKKGCLIDHNSTALLSDFLGSDLSKLANELDKLIILINQKNISAKEIEQHIGISKDYNIFELQNALANRQVLKANKIINYFAMNTKNHNIIPIISSLFSFFQKVIIYHQIKNKSVYEIAKDLKINKFFIKQYQIGAIKYNKKQLLNIFKYLKEYDLKSKGVNNKNTSSSALLKELTLKILNT